MKNKGDEWIEQAVGNRAGTRFFIKVINLFGLFPAYFFLFFASCQYLFFDRKSSAAIRNYRRRLGLSTSKLHLFRHFYSFGVTLIDRYAYMGKRESHRFKTLHSNEERIIREVGQGKGVILLGAHFGNWEFAGNLLTKRITARVHVFMYATGNEYKDGNISVINNLIIHHVQNAASDIAVEIINALRSGDIVCMHGDRFIEGQRTETIDFLGKTARFPVGPMALAAITGAPVIICHTVRTALFSYTFSAEEPVQISAGVDRTVRDEQMRSALEKYVSVLEKMCRKYPYQWYNFYQFWENS